MSLSSILKQGSQTPLDVRFDTEEDPDDESGSDLVPGVVFENGTDMEQGLGGDRDSQRATTDLRSAMIKQFSTWTVEDEGIHRVTSEKSNRPAIATKELQSVDQMRKMMLITIIVSFLTIVIMMILYLSKEDGGNSDTLQYPFVAAVMTLPILGTVFLYDVAVRRAIQTLDKAANKSTAIVNNLFPENVRARVLKQQSRRFGSKTLRDSDKQVRRGRRTKPIRRIQQSLKASPTSSTTTNLNQTSSPNESKDAFEILQKDILQSKPIADFFPNCTVLFADIVGFTAWSSVRDPTDVFTLLESLYSSFDILAQKFLVFKVETIGDCYVAVTGLPEPMKDHALIMARFARQCMWKMNEIVHALEVHLGPDTGDLSMRFGLHSGPVTAGVMRGEKSRFQLFGDTVNTAARVESTGERDKVHLSAETADLIVEAGKPHWISPRETMVNAKGKGKLQTYWLRLEPSRRSSIEGDGIASTKPNIMDNAVDSTQRTDENDELDFCRSLHGKNDFEERRRRQTDYAVEVLTRVLKKLIASRGHSSPPEDVTELQEVEGSTLDTRGIFEDVSDVLVFPQEQLNTLDVNKIRLSEGIQNQLLAFVTDIAGMYKQHPFHNFERMSHVLLSLTQLYSKLKTCNADDKYSPKVIFGLREDALAEFALIFTAMIHDVDHPGVPNGELLERGSELAAKFGKESPAEINSLEVGWKILMRPAYAQLRLQIYTTQAEFERFRKLVTKFQMATDLVDVGRSGERQKRWDIAFLQSQDEPKDLCNQKATLLMETMIQAADIAHYIQHWNVYLKWNRRLFEEQNEDLKKSNTLTQEPVDTWFEAELSFFDAFVIPLATRLRDSGAFGEEAEEYLNYAKSNRNDWQSKGREVVLEFLSEMRGEDSESDEESEWV